MRRKVSRSAIERMLSETARAYPKECCGILLGSADFLAAALPARNVHPAPDTHFEIDPRALIDAHRAARAGGPQVVGYYHSHPDGPAAPSATDLKMAAQDGRVWAIIGASDIGETRTAPTGIDATEKIKFWRDTRQGFAPVTYEVHEV